jgi:hypothetical protein
MENHATPATHKATRIGRIRAASAFAMLNVSARAGIPEPPEIAKNVSTGATAMSASAAQERAYRPPGEK